MLKRIRPLNEKFAKLVDYRTYRLLRRSQTYNLRVARKTARCQKKLNAQMKGHFFSETDPISALNFLQRFRTACSHNELTEEAAL